MDATHRQRIRRAVALMLIGTLGGLIVSGDPVRALRTPAFLLMTLGMGVWTVAENIVLRQDEPGSYRGRTNTRLLQLAMMVAIFFAVMDLFHLQLLAHPRWLMLLGVGVLLVGATIRVVAIRALAEHFRYELRVEAGQTLVREGLYRRIRHPSYLGLLLLLVGATLTLESVPAALFGAIALIPLLVLRMNDEERVLADAFGDDYERYRRETWRLIPYVY